LGLRIIEECLRQTSINGNDAPVLALRSLASQ
jgi:hypothetical protein